LNIQTPKDYRPYRKLTEPEVYRALAVNHGLLTQSATALGCSRIGLENFIKKRPHLIKFMEEQVELILDVAEGNVISGIYQGDDKYTRWFLDRRGRNRGYGASTTVTGPNGEPVPFTMIERVPPLVIEHDANSQR
jgi:hypothetical protein